MAKKGKRSKRAAPPLARPRAAASKWSVLYHWEAVVEYEAIKDRRARRAVLTVVSFLRDLGPRLTEPHSKSVKGATKLLELRPGGGKILFRPLYARVGNRFVVLAIAPEAVEDQSGFNSAVARARKRAKDDCDVDV